MSKLSLGNLAILTVAIAAADEAPWLDVPTPEERQAAGRELVGTYADLGLNPLPLSRQEGNVLWGRIAGTESLQAAARYIQQKFGEFGLHKTGSIPRNTQWWPRNRAWTGLRTRIWNAARNP